MSQLFTELLRSVATHVERMPERKYCAKCQGYRLKTGGTGVGRQYRCASCSDARRKTQRERAA